MRKLIQLSGRRGRRARALLCAAMLVVFGLVVSALKLWQYRLLQTAAYDHGIQANVSWNVAHGYGFVSSIQNMNYLGDHFSPIHAATGLLFHLWESPAVLLLLQTWALVLGGWGVYRLARLTLRDGTLSLALTALYLLNPHLHWLSRFDYHPVALAVPVLIWMLVAMCRGRWGWFFALACVGVTIKENVPLAVAGVGAMLCLVRGRRLVGGLTLLSSLAAFALVLLAMSHFNPGDANTHIGRYANLGADEGEILTAPLRCPQLLWTETVGDPLKAKSLLALLLTVGLLPLLGGVAIVPLIGPVGWNLVSDYGHMWRLSVQYSANILPFLFFASAVGLGRLNRWIGDRGGRTWQRVAIGVLLGLAAAWSVWRMPTYVDDQPPSREAVAAFHRMRGRIGPEDAVLASRRLVPTLSARHDIRRIEPGDPRGADGVDWIVFDVNAWPWPFDTPGDYRRALLVLMDDSDFGVVEYQNGIALLGRGEPGGEKHRRLRDWLRR
jgi:uncharacterized membrane protein